MAISTWAGKPAPKSSLLSVEHLTRDYYANKPEVGDPQQRVSFGTSGHRGTSADGTFTEAHILAITQAIVEYRAGNGITGPLYMGKDTHALSGPAERTALEVLAGNKMEVVVAEAHAKEEVGDDAGADSFREFTPTPVISWLILGHNRKPGPGRADGIVITPSHNPPGDGGFKYNTTNGGPADTDVTGWIQDRANVLLREGNKGVKRIAYERALKAGTTWEQDFVGPYVRDLAGVVDIDAIKRAGVRMGADPLGGASLAYWHAIKEFYGLDLTIVNDRIDPTFGFMTVDHDGKIRMDCSSPWAMAGLVGLKDKYQVAFGNDPDSDRHGIVTPTAGLLNPNHYLAVAIQYLLTHRDKWARAGDAAPAVGKTLVSSSMIDRVTASLGRKLCEVPVGFKWFAPGLFDGSICFGGEESAGASFLRRDGTVWSTDKDGIILALLAAEMTAKTGKDPGVLYEELTAKFGTPHYTRIDAPATPEQKAAFKKLTPEAVKATTLAGEKIMAKLTTAPGNGAAIGGLKVVTASGWFAARPSGTENIYKIYAESFQSRAHLEAIVTEAEAVVAAALA